MSTLRWNAIIFVTTKIEQKDPWCLMKIPGKIHRLASYLMAIRILNFFLDFLLKISQPWDLVCIKWMIEYTILIVHGACEFSFFLDSEFSLFFFFYSDIWYNWTQQQCPLSFVHWWLWTKICPKPVRLRLNLEVS